MTSYLENLILYRGEAKDVMLEIEAEYIGTCLLSAANYDISQLPSFWARFDEKYKRERKEAYDQIAKQGGRLPVIPEKLTLESRVSTSIDRLFRWHRARRVEPEREC